MAEQGPSGSSKRAAGGRAKQALTSGNVADLRDALGELVDPLGLVMLTRERIEDALEDAVSRGRVTADDAQDLVASLVERGRRQTNDLLGDLEQRVGGGTSTEEAPGGEAPLAIAGYDGLTAVEVNRRLGGLDHAQLRRVRDHERANANRKTVLAAIDKRLK